MNKEKRYMLKKDLPHIKSGTHFVQSRPDGYYNSQHEKITSFTQSYPAHIVENNPEWFEEIKEQSVTFIGAKWSDQKNTVDFELSNGVNYQIPKDRLVKFLIEDDRCVWSEKEKPKEQPDRIEVSNISLSNSKPFEGWHHYTLNIKKLLTNDDLLLIKQAIERVLNNEIIDWADSVEIKINPTHEYYINYPYGGSNARTNINGREALERMFGSGVKKYTEKEKTEAEERGFNAGNETTAQHVRPYLKYKSFSDYKKQNP